MQTKREQWASRLAAWESSGLSQAAWCQAQGVSLASFGYWRRRLSGADAPAAVLPIRVAAPAVAQALEVHLPNGILLRVPGVELATLLPLLRTLAAC